MDERVRRLLWRMTMREHQADECGVCRIPYFERNNYFHGKTLSARDLFAEQRYFNEKRWLINRSVIGWGIVCGLEVSVEGDCLTVTPGLALDCCGRELLICERETLHLQSLAEQVGIEHSQKDGLRWVLCLEYRECKTEPVVLPPSCDQQERGREYNRIRDDYRLRFRLWSDACAEDHSVDCCPDPGLGRTGSIHQIAVNRSRKCPSCKDCDCVVLATGWWKGGAQPHGRIEPDPDSWKYRRTVYTNALLANLLSCFHGRLAHITDISWKQPSYHVEEFLRELRGGLQVTFDREMTKSTVENRRSCRLSILIARDGEGCLTQVVVPVRHIDYNGTAATYHFDYSCVEDELRRTCQKHQRPADVELVLHGSMIHDSSGRAVDAELIRDFPTGNGVEGGEFIAFYTVEP